MLLQSEDKVYLYLSGNQQSTNGINNGLSISVGCDVGWQVIQLPQLYIHNNWPIKVIQFIFSTLILTEITSSLRVSTIRVNF